MRADIHTQHGPARAARLQTVAPARHHMRELHTRRDRRPVWSALVSSALAAGLTAATLGRAATASASGSTTAPGGRSTHSAPGGTSSGTAPPDVVNAQTQATSPTTSSTTVPLATPTESETETTTATTPRSHAPAVARQRSQQTTEGVSAPAKAGASDKTPRPAARKTKPASATGANDVALPPQLVAAQAEALAQALGAAQASSQALGFYRIPLFLLPIYKAAAARYAVPWQILAAINEIETDYGTDLSVSSAGAVGWMQFMPATWLQYGVDALDAGYADPYNPVDAIFAAARYLRAAGSATDLRAAILAYNHSQAYLESVLLRAQLISSYPNNVVATLTALTDARMPVTGSHVSWEAPTRAAIAHGLQLVRLKAAPNASVVAVQDGRIVDVGKSHRLGRFVVLRDVYGDEFTYAALGSVAPSYATPRQAPAQLLARAVRAEASASARAASALAEPSVGTPITLTVTPPPGAHAVRRHAAVSAVSGKVRLYAHPGNPDAIVAAELDAPSPPAGPRYPLRSGAEVQTGTVLGRLNVPSGADEGRISFAIRPAGDHGTIDPRAVLGGWAQLRSALYPQGAKTAEALLGATASAVLAMSSAELRQALLSDPGVALDAHSRELISAGAVDRRLLAAVAFLSRCGLKPTLSVREDARAGSGAARQAALVADISAVGGIAIDAHQGSGTIADLTVRTLLAMPTQAAPHAIWSLMRYPGAPQTHASTADAKRIRIEFKSLVPTANGSAASNTAAARLARGRAQAAVQPPAGVHLSAAEWEQLIDRISALPAPTVAGKASSSAVPDASAR
jgi:membrane-bound lytic murein transglycosylase B